MDDKMRIAIVVIVIIVLAIPILGRLAKEGSTEEGAATGETAKEQKAPEPVLEPPLIDANNIVNSKWQVTIKGFPVTVTFQAGGQAIGESPMLKRFTGQDQVPVTWSISGAELTLTASAMGKTQTGKLKISGNNILVEGKPATRLQ